MWSRGSSGTSQMSLGRSTRSRAESGGGGGRHPYLDPQEWARRRQAAVEHAARLREERALGGPLDESYLFSPQVNNKGQQHLTLARQRTQQRTSLTVARRHYQQQHEQDQQLSMPRRRSIAGGGPPPPPALGASLSAASSFALATVAPPVYTHSLSQPLPHHQQQQQTRVTTAMVPAAVTWQHKKAGAGWGNEGPALPMRRGLPPSAEEEATVGLGAGQTSAFAKKRSSSNSSSSSSAGGGGTETPALTRKGSQSQGGKSRGSVKDVQRSGLTSKPAWVTYREAGGCEKDRAEKDEVDKEEAEGEGAASAAGVLAAPSSSLALLKAKLRGKAAQQQERKPRAVLREEAGEDGWTDAKEEDHGEGEDGTDRNGAVVRAAASGGGGGGGGGGTGGHGQRRRHRQQWSHGPYNDARLEGEEEEAPPAQAPIPPRPIRAAPAAANQSSNKWGGGPRAGGDGLLTECGGCGRRFNERALEVHTKICYQVFQSRRAVFDSRRKRFTGTEAGKYHTTLSSPARALPVMRRGRQRPKGKAVAGQGPNALVVKQQQRQQGQGQEPRRTLLFSSLRLHQQHAEEEEEDGSRTFHSLSATSSAPSLGLHQHNNGDKPFPATLEAQATPKWRHQSEAFRAMLQRSRAISRAEKEGRKITPAFLASLPDPSAAAGPHGDVEPLVPCPSCGRKFNAVAAERHMPKCRDIVHKPNTLRRGEGLGLGKAARERAAGGGGGERRRGGGWKL